MDILDELISSGPKALTKPLHCLAAEVCSAGGVKTESCLDVGMAEDIHHLAWRDAQGVFQISRNLVFQ